MNQNINLFISFAAGLLSFVTPCVLPLVPSYISFIGGMTLQDIKLAEYKKYRLILRTLVFVAGFTLVFVLMGMFIWGAFQVLSGFMLVLNIIAGLVVILLGLNIIFNFFSFLNREKRITLEKRPVTYIGAFAAGMAFGAGWSPCIGPLLGGIISLTASGGSIWGFFNLLAYSLGLGLPFVLLSLAFMPVVSYLEKIKKHFATLRIISGIFLVLVGILILLGQFIRFTSFFLQAGSALETAYAASPAAVELVIGSLYLIIGGLPLAVVLLRKRKHGLRLAPKTVISLVFFCVMVVLAVLEFTGVLQSALLVSRWFAVQEISPL